MAGLRTANLNVQTARSEVTSNEFRSDTYLELSCPQMSWRVGDDPPCPISLDARNHVVAITAGAFGDDAESVVFHDGGEADAAE